MDLNELYELYKTELPKWERYIYSYAYKLITKYRGIISWSVDVEDICQELRISLWRAIQKYEEARECSLSSYIHLLLKNDSVSILQQQYREHPKESPEQLYQVIPFSGLGVDETLDLLNNVKDPDTPTAQTIIDQVWFEREIDLIYKIMQPRRTSYTDKDTGIVEMINWHEKDVLQMLLSRKYKSDSAISKILKINFAKVGEVRAIIRAALCLLNGWNIMELSEDLNLDILVQRTYLKLCKHVITSELYSVDKVLPPDEWRSLLINKSKSMPPERGKALLTDKGIEVQDNIV